MLKLKYVCNNDWDMPVYKDQNDKLWLDTNFGKGNPDLHKSSNNEIDGEPDYRINSEYQFVTKYEENPNRFDYMMLDRLRSDCDYYLGCGCRCENRVSGKNGIDTIAEMKRLWNSLPVDGKPEWLSIEDIEEYEQEMITPSGKYNDPYAWGEHRRSKRNKEGNKMQKEKFMKALENINKIEDLFLKADKLFDEIELEIQKVILKYHNETGTMQHCLRWGLQAVEDIREDWYTVVAGIPCGEIMTQEAKELYVYTTDHFNDDLEKISISCVAPLIAIRQVVKRAINQYIKDYCCDNDALFTQEDFESVSKKILRDKEENDND